MYNNYTFDDYLEATDKINFIIDVINDFKASDFYNTATTAKAYYEGDNIEIMQRKKQFVNAKGCLQDDIFKANNLIPSGFFTKITKQANSYLLANGVNIPKEIKDNLGKKLDIKVQKAGLEAHVSGVSWGYAHIDKNGKFNLDTWKGTEFIPLYDERYSILRAGIRFWQTKSDKPLYIEFYEEDGYSYYKKQKDKDGYKIEVLEKKTPYITIKKIDELETTVEGMNWNELPIYPLYANDLKKSPLTTMVKNQIDLYDIVMSDFGNLLEDSQDVYWIIKNYDGQDLSTFIDDYKKYKTIPVSGDGDAKHQTIDIPYEARKEALEMIKKNIYDFTMSVDVESIRGGSNATTTEIDAAFYDLDMKTNEFENNVIDFLSNIIDLYLDYKGQFIDYTISFTRDRLMNKSELLDMIYTAREDLSRRKTLELVAGLIDGLEITDVDGILDQIDEEGMQTVDIPVDTVDNIEEV